MASLISVLKKAGFHGEGLRIAYAVAMAESHGDATNHNDNPKTGDDSYGLFQINMYQGMGPERRARYGLGSNNDLYDPLTNARIAYRMSNGGRNWNAWSTYIGGQYSAFLDTSGATVTYSQGKSTVKSGPKLSNDELLQKYGLTAAMVNSSSDLKRLFREAVAGGYSAALFSAKLRNTNWWKNQSNTLRQYLTLKYTDPATWRQKNAAAQAKINALAVQVGLGSQIHTGDATKLLRQAIYNSVALGWTDARIKDWLGARVTTHDGVMWGEAGEAFDKLHEIAYLNGMKYGDWFASQAKGIVSGRTTLEAAEAHIRRQAAAKYSAFADQIKAGQNALDLAAPYIKSVAGILELPETDIDLSNKYINDAMTGAKAGANYPIWEFENKLRADPQWLKTNNAREGMMSTAHQVLKDFGLSF